jgi:serine/threonine protein kinase
MGTVFQAVHERTGGRYALKTISFQADAELRARFVREGQAQALVDSHPNVVRVHSAGEARGALYLVMDLASGGDLADRLRHGPMHWRDAAELVRALARGLEHVHAHGVLHRDLKPANVLFDGDEVPKLVDFGVARIAGAANRLTHTGDIMGTPSFMSPEQSQGIQDEIDERTDIYGLGAILYNCLTGSPPFVGATSLSILTLVNTKPPAPPRSIVAEIPATLDAICLKALAKSPDDRFKTATEFREALDAFTDPAEGSTDSGSTNQRLMAIGGVAAGVLGVTAVLTLTFATPTAPTATVDAPPLSNSPPEVVEPEAPPVEPVDLTPAALNLRRRPYSKGESFRSRLTIGGSRAFPPADGGMILVAPRGSADFTFGLDLGFTVDWVSAEEAQLTASIQHLKVSRSSSAGTIAFDSAVAPKRTASPFRVAVGRTLTLMVDQQSGHIKSAKGLVDIQMNVWAKAREFFLPLEDYLLEGFDSGDSLRSILSKVLHVFPTDSVPPTADAWDQRETLDMAKLILAANQEVMEQYGARPLLKGRWLGPVRSFRAVRVDDATELAWSGEDEVREQSGSASLVDGRVRLATSNEQVEIDFAIGTSEVTQVRVLVKSKVDYQLLDD